MRRASNEFNAVEQFFEQVFENEIFQVGMEQLRQVRRIVGSAPQEQIELIMSRTDQDALNRFSLIMVETVVKRLEYQINHNQIAHCKAWLNTFIIFAKQSKRFRDTIRRSHTIHLWLGLLRNSAQWESHILTEALAAMHVVILEINSAFNTEYVYWKKWIPDLVDLFLNCHSRQRMPFQNPPYEEFIDGIFIDMLRNDFSFLGHAHTQMESKRYFQLLQIAEVLTHHIEFEWSNYDFCSHLAQKLIHQEWPETIGEGHPERRRVNQLIQLLSKIYKQRVYRNNQEDLLSSSSSDGESAGGDEEEDVTAMDSGGEENRHQNHRGGQQQQIVVHQNHPSAPVQHYIVQNTLENELEEEEEEEEDDEDIDGDVVLMVRGREEERTRAAAGAVTATAQIQNVLHFSTAAQNPFLMNHQQQQSPRQQHPNPNKFQFRPAVAAVVPNNNSPLSLRPHFVGGPLPKHPPPPPPPPPNNPPPPTIQFLQQQQQNFQMAKQQQQQHNLMMQQQQQQRQRSPIRVLEEEAQEEEDEIIQEDQQQQNPKEQQPQMEGVQPMEEDPDHHQKQLRTNSNHNNTNHHHPSPQQQQNNHRNAAAPAVVATITTPTAVHQRQEPMEKRNSPGRGGGGGNGRKRLADLA